MRKKVGSRGQLSLGKKYAGRYFEVEQQPDGALLLRPMKVIPDSEAWVREPAMREQLRRAYEWSNRTPRAETNLEKLIENAARRARKRI